MAKLKVLILSHSSELSGAERSMVDLFAYWDKQGLIDPHFIIRYPVQNLAPELKKHGWVYSPVYYTNWSQRNPSKQAESRFRNAYYNSMAVEEIEKIIQRLKPDVVMTNTIVAPWAAIAAYFQRVPHVWFVREYGDIDHRHVYELGREKTLQDISDLSVLVATNSQTLAEHISDQVDKKKLAPVYTPFDLEALRAKSQQKASNPFRSPDSLKLVITGKIAPGKGQLEAIEAVAQLNKAGHDTELCIIGKTVEPGDDKPVLDLIEQHGLADKVHLVGHLANPMAVLKYADVGLMASRQEAFGRVTYEYMAIGLPVVGTDSGATPEMIDEGQNGYLYPPGQSQELVNKLSNYAADRQLIKKHGAAGQAKAEAMLQGQFSADQLFKKITATLADKKLTLPKPLNFSRRWLEYPIIADQYIKDAHVMALHKLLYHRGRNRAKWAYLTAARVPKYIKKRGRRVPRQP